MALTFEIAGAQIDGARDYQEDAFLITHLTDKDGKPCSLVVVADGMGGHAAGNVASNMAVQAFNKHVSANFPSEYISEVLNGAVLKANHSIAETIKETPALDGMGCTMVGVLLQSNSIWWASVGDSHLYLIRNRELSKINADHSYGGFLDAMAAAGTPIDPEPGLSRNMLMSAVTGAEIADIDCPSSPLQLQAGDKILICSDGMDTLSEGKIIQYSEWSDTPKECADALLNAVEEAEMPKQDNTTVIVVNIVDKEAEAAKAAEPPDDEDITDTSGAAKEDNLEKTTELADEATGEHKVVEETPVPEESEPVSQPEPEPEPTPKPASKAAYEPVTKPSEYSETKSNKGLIFGIAAGLIIAIAVGGYVMLGGKKEISVEVEPVTTSTEPEQITAPAEETTSAPETATEKPVVTEKPPVQEEPVVEKSTPKEAPAVVETPKQAETPAPAPAPATPAKKEFSDNLKVGGKGPEMVWIPAGTFQMGSPGSSTNADERPEHTVTVKKFAMSKYEITFTDYEKFAKATGHKMPDNLYMDKDTTPVFFVSWDDAYNYAKWLSDQTGKKYRLPSEAEWEYAASGGKNSPFWWGFNEESGKAHCFTCESQLDPRKPAKIGSFDPNQFGLYDTAGNVAEWVHDCWHDDYKGAPDDGSVWEGGDCTQRVARGGSFISPQQSIRTEKRDKFKSDSGYDHIGIRVVRDE